MGGPISGVSIVLTSYNYGRFISRTLASASAQRGDNIEIVVVDNASTDDSWSIIQSWAAKDDRIRAYRNDENIGMIANHVRGLNLATRERVLFLSADDYLLPGHVSRLLSAHSQHPEIDYFFTTYAHVDENDAFLRFLGHIGHLRGSYFGGRNEFADLLTYDCYTCTPTTLFDRAQMVAQGGFDPNVICGDLEAYLRLSGSGARFGFIDTVGVAVRMHSAEVTGKERYVATGKQLLDHLYLLERYLAPKYELLVRGREIGIARLLQAKMNNLAAYPVAQEILAAEKPRIDAIVARLNDLRSRTLAERPALSPLVSVVAIADDDVNGTAHLRKQLEKQTYANWELIVATHGSYDASPLIQDRAEDRTLTITYRSAHSRAAMLNDMARLASGDVVTYADTTIEWPENHLQRIVAALSDTRIDALCVPVDLVVTRAGADVARYPNYYGGDVAEKSARVGEAVPLTSLAHRRRLFDVAGYFEESLAHLVDFEFVQRVFAHGPLGIDDSAALTQRMSYDSLHPALSDPNTYVSSLRAIYEGRPVDETATQQRLAHFNRLNSELRALSAAPDTTRAHLFSSISRGDASRARANHSVTKRVLVIDDCVPYNELGRGYPRARTILEDLRDEGYEVMFYPLVRPFDDAPMNYGIPGVKILYGQGPELLGLTLEAELSNLDILWVSRPHNMRDVQCILRAIEPPTPPIVYDAEAVYVERNRVRAELENRPLPPERYQEALSRELSYTDGCAIVSAVSAGERALIATHFEGPIEVLSFSIDAAPTPASYNERDGILFVGAIEEDSPNDDALFFFASSVAPMLPAIPLRHAGVMNSSRLRNTAVQFLGIVPDLRPIYNASRMFIAPTRFAAGLPQKVYEAAAHGLPVIASSLIASQLGWQPESDLLVADTPQEWKTAVERLNTDAVLWNRLREAGLARVREEVSPAAFRSRVASIARRALASVQPQVHA